MLNKLTVTFAAALLLTGCVTPTPYQPYGPNGGYSETQLDVNVFNVYFNGNRQTSTEKSELFALIRSAELTLQKGHLFFQIHSGKTGTSNSVTTSVSNFFGDGLFSTATTTVTPSTSNTIIIFKERPANGFSYNAEYIYNQHRHLIPDAECIAMEINDGDTKITTLSSNPASCNKYNKWQGVWDVRGINGAVATGPYVDGKKHGQWEFTTLDGLVETGPYENGRRNGRWEFRSPDKRVSAGQFVDGKKHGRWETRDEYGVPVKFDEFINGVLQ